MNKIKQPTVAGAFYPSDTIELIRQIEILKEHGRRDYSYKTRAVIVPHAGYVYSGQLAFDGIQYLDETAENIFIIAPAHKYKMDGCALSSFEEWQTPLGNVSVNQEINNILKEKYNAQFVDDAFDSEHSVEVQLPFLQTYFDGVKIIPILVGSESPDVIRDIIKEFYPDKKNAFVISSDLSHFHKGQEAKQIDNITAQMIEHNDLSKFSYEQACGAAGIFGLMTFARENNFSLIRVGMYNSGDITGDTSRVVGYGSWLLYEGEKNEFIKETLSKYTIDVVKASIDYYFNHGQKMSSVALKYIPEVFKQEGACFVTLEINNNLRGCMGSIVPTGSLIDDLVSNSYNAAFSDTRFRPLEKSEFYMLDIDVSLLSMPEKMNFKDETDLLSQITPNRDGLIIKDGNHQATYLPSVWEQLPEKTEFLNSLKAKAGLRPDHFSNTFEVFRYHTSFIK